MSIRSLLIAGLLSVSLVNGVPFAQQDAAPTDLKSLSGHPRPTGHPTGHPTGGFAFPSGGFGKGAGRAHSSGAFGHGHFSGGPRPTGGDGPDGPQTTGAAKLRKRQEGEGEFSGGASKTGGGAGGHGGHSKGPRPTGAGAQRAKASGGAGSKGGAGSDGGAGPAGGAKSSGGAKGPRPTGAGQNTKGGADAQPTAKPRRGLLDFLPKRQDSAVTESSHRPKGTGHPRHSGSGKGRNFAHQTGGAGEAYGSGFAGFAGATGSGRPHGHPSGTRAGPRPTAAGRV